MKRTLLLAGFALVLALPARAETGRDIMQSVIDNQSSASSARDLVMTLIDESGRTSTRRLQTLTRESKGLTDSITIFMEPASVRGTRFLTIENSGRNDDQWIYLPALRKVKRIAAGEREGSFMGSDFSYSDMSAASASLDDSEHRILREETFRGADCWVIESVPRAGTDQVYGKNISWVDKKSRLTLKVQFYDKSGGKEIKELIMEDPRQIQGHWVAMKTTMTTLDSGHKTLIETRQIKFDMPLNPGYFTPGFLQTGRAQ